MLSAKQLYKPTGVKWDMLCNNVATCEVEKIYNHFSVKKNRKTIALYLDSKLHFVVTEERSFAKWRMKQAEPHFTYRPRVRLQPLRNIHEASWTSLTYKPRVRLKAPQKYIWISVSDHMQPLTMKCRNSNSVGTVCDYLCFLYIIILLEVIKWTSVIWGNNMKNWHTRQSLGELWYIAPFAKFDA